MGERVIKMFIDSSCKLLEEYEKKGRYYHTLSPQDNSPTVVHKITNQLTYIMNGFGQVVLNGEIKNINAGDIIFIEAGTTHRFRASSNELTLFHIHIPDTGRDNDRHIIEGQDYNRFE